MATLWKGVAEPSGNPPGPLQAARTTHAGEDWLPSPTIKATRLLCAPFHFVHTAGCCNANAKSQRVHACTRCSLYLVTVSCSMSH